MKARVKTTGEIVDVIAIDGDWLFCSNGIHYGTESLEGIESELDYWEKLLHQYAGMAMQGLLASGDWDECSWDIIAEDAIRASTALVEKLKGE